MATGKRYSLNLDKEPGASSYNVFVNTRFDAGDGKTGITSLGLAVDKLAETIRSYKVGKSGFVYLVRPNGTLIMHRDTALADGKHNMKDLPGFSDKLTASCSGDRYASAAIPRRTASGWWRRRSCRS
jgi:methyl-accepting chemotaxis protein